MAYLLDAVFLFSLGIALALATVAFLVRMFLKPAGISGSALSAFGKAVLIGALLVMFIAIVVKGFYYA